MRVYACERVCVCSFVNGPWDYFFIVTDHTIAVAIEGVCTSVVLVLARLDNRPKYSHGFVKYLILDCNKDLKKRPQS